MKIIITGSHFTPAQATITELKKMVPDLEIIYLGRKSTFEGDKTVSVESVVLPRLGVKFIPIISGRRSSIISLIKIPVGIIQSSWVILTEDPDIVLSFGGYSAIPVIVSSYLLSKPILIHEQTLVTGLANKISSWFADKIAVSFKTKFDFPPDKIVVTGNPMRVELIKPDPKNVSDEIRKIISKKTQPLILITGGNQGSHIINQRVAECIISLTAKYLVIHQTGNSKFKDFENLSMLKKTLKNPDRYLIRKWLEVDELGLIYKNCDLAVCRAGINTLLELNYFRIKNIVIPIKNHYEQNFNADYFSKNGLSVKLSDSELASNKLLETIKKILEPKSNQPLATRHQLPIFPDAGKFLALETLLGAAKLR